MMTRKIVIAIIDSNALTRMGLHSLLEEIIPMADIKDYRSFDDLPMEDVALFAHYFVASHIYFEHTSFFRSAPVKTIILTGGEMEVSGMLTLNVWQDEQRLVRDILALRSMGHGKPHASEEVARAVPLLSARETEVAILLCKGCINKEVADRLNISLPTVVTHRKNIMKKLNARSLADVIVYCVMNGIVDVENL